MFFPEFFSEAAVGNCEEYHMPCHGNCGGKCPTARRSKSPDLSQSDLLVLR